MNLKVLVIHAICILLTINGLHAKVKKESKVQENEAEIADQEAVPSEKHVPRHRRGNHDLTASQETVPSEKHVPRHRRGNHDLTSSHHYHVIKKPIHHKFVKNIHDHQFDEPKVIHTFSEVHEHVDEKTHSNYDSKDSGNNYGYEVHKELNIEPQGSEHYHEPSEPAHYGEKIKHHHHHHHHIKTIVQKVPVEKIIRVPVEKLVHVPKLYPVEKVVEKIVRVPIEKIVHVPKPYAVEKIVEKVVHVPVEKVVYVPKPYPVEKVVHVPVEKIVKETVPVEKIVEKIVHVPKPYPVIKPVPYPVQVKVPTHTNIPQPYSAEKEISAPLKTYDSHSTSYTYDQSSGGGGFFDHQSYGQDYSSQDSQIQAVHIPNESNQVNNEHHIHHHHNRHNQPQYEYSQYQQIQAPPSSLQMKNRGPQTFPANSPQQQEQNHQNLRLQRHLQQQTVALNNKSIHPNHHHGHKPKQLDAQNAESALQPSIARPENKRPLSNNVQIMVAEQLPEPQALVQSLPPTNHHQIAIQLLPMQPGINAGQATLEVYPNMDQL